jgi:hypothetical protein
MLLTETHRGEVDRGPDQLSLSRQWWLDFDGQGFSIRDEIQRRGQQHQAPRGPAAGPARLRGVAGDAAVHHVADGDRPPGGRAAQHRTCDLRADMRCRRRARDGAVGGRLGPGLREREREQLHLPPGWRLLHVVGVDEVNDTWLQRWTLLDIFLVLVISIAIGRMYGWAWGTLSLVTLALVLPGVDGAAVRVDQFVLIAEAIHRALPAGRPREVMRLVRFAALLTLTGIVLMFSVQQIRGGLYPALAVRSDNDDFGRWPSATAPSRRGRRTRSRTRRTASAARRAGWASRSRW